MFKICHWKLGREGNHILSLTTRGHRQKQSICFHQNRTTRDATHSREERRGVAFRKVQQVEVLKTLHCKIDRLAIGQFYEIPWLFPDSLVNFEIQWLFPDFSGPFSNSLTFLGFPGRVATLLSATLYLLCKRFYPLIISRLMWTQTINFSKEKKMRISMN